MRESYPILMVPPERPRLLRCRGNVCFTPDYLRWSVLPRYNGLVPSQMEDLMCWEINYKFLAELEKARETRIKQERRAGVIDNLLNEVNQQSDKTNVEGTTVKEIAPAK